MATIDRRPGCQCSRRGEVVRDVTGEIAIGFDY
jgi:hypothetical protein